MDPLKEGELELIIIWLEFYLIKISLSKFRGDCEHILSEIRHDMADLYLKML